MRTYIESFASGDFPCPLHHLIHSVEIKVRQQGRNYSPLWHPLLPVRFENEFQQMHDLIILHPPGHFLQQEVMPYVVKISAQVYVDYSCKSMQYPSRHPVYCLMCVTFESVPIRATLEIRLKDRLKY